MPEKPPADHKTLMPETYDVFLSHSRGEAEVARDLASLLRSAQLRVFLAEDTIAAGENWYRPAEEAAQPGGEAQAAPTW
jgi:TIR domain